MVSISAGDNTQSLDCLNNVPPRHDPLHPAAAGLLPVPGGAQRGQRGEHPAGGQLDTGRQHERLVLTQRLPGERHQGDEVGLHSRMTRIT